MVTMLEPWMHSSRLTDSGQIYSNLVEALVEGSEVFWSDRIDRRLSERGWRGVRAEEVEVGTTEHIPGQQPGNTLLLLEQYSDDELDEGSSEGHNHAVAGDASVDIDEEGQIAAQEETEKDEIGVKNQRDSVSVASRSTKDADYCSILRPCLFIFSFDLQHYISWHENVQKYYNICTNRKVTISYSFCMLTSSSAIKQVDSHLNRVLQLNQLLCCPERHPRLLYLIYILLLLRFRFMGVPH